MVGAGAPVEALAIRALVTMAQATTALVTTSLGTMEVAKVAVRIALESMMTNQVIMMAIRRIMTRLQAQMGKIRKILETTTLLRMTNMTIRTVEIEDNKEPQMTSKTILRKVTIATLMTPKTTLAKTHPPSKF